MEAELVDGLPTGERWRYEPKWDGFRGVFENDGGELALWSRNGRPLLRYFPELRAIGAGLPPHSALDGEIVIEREGALDFDAMQMRSRSTSSCGTARRSTNGRLRIGASSSSGARPRSRCRRRRRTARSRSAGSSDSR